MLVECPSCGMTAEAPSADRMGGIRCTHCRALFTLPETEVESAPPEVEEHRELSAARVRMLSARKRSLLRTRTYILVAAVVLAVAAIALVIKSVQGTMAMGSVGVRQALLFMAAWPCGFVAARLMRLYRQHTKLLLASDLAEPTTPPDFSTLSNGDQRWKNLERVR